jgi:hypothetical protein
MQAQHKPRDDPQRALRADQNVLQVIAGVVLDHLVEGGDHRPVRQHPLRAEHQGAHHAVPVDAVAAGVGRGDAAHLRGSAPAKIEREEEADRLGGVLGRLQRHASLECHGGRVDVDLLDLTHGLQR